MGRNNKLEADRRDDHTPAMIAAYLDPRTGQTFPLDQPRWCGTDLAPLLLTPLPGIARSDIDPGVRGLWRYQ
ncbi:MAG: hypothetical protein ABI369_02600, partial [Acetobacteraceae bacterium]